MVSKIKKLKYYYLALIDIGLIYLSYYLAMFIKYDFEIPNYMSSFNNHIIITLIIYLIIFYLFKMYNSLWQFASIEEFARVILANIIAVINTLVVYKLFNIDFVDMSVIIIALLLTIAFTFGLRVSYRIFRIVSIYKNRNKNDLIRTIIIGAGSAGNLIRKEIQNNSALKTKIVGFIDDSSDKKGKNFGGIKVLGKIDEIPQIIKKYDIKQIIVAIPSASKSEINRTLNICKDLHIRTKILPPFYEVLDKDVSIKKMRDVKIEDLLGREVIKLDDDGISNYLQNKTVLVTGGGGSIGSELCRQIVKYKPNNLIILDIYENNAYDLQNELKRSFYKSEIINQPQITVLIASVRDEKRIKEIFNQYRPNVVFHAAAHKHVPLMENNPKEAIKNNIFGTYNVVKAADEYNVEKFVLISTDKAVNPTNIMGATKRFAEMIIQSFDSVSKTNFTAVRFGNVLGSNGSVIPLFNKQIEEGGPITVTHKDIIRYFMTIPEACQLVLQAGSSAKGGEIFVLDMGEPVKILDLAENLIKLNGLKPYEDIDIIFTGLRPGEKMYEELLMDEEGLQKTDNKKIYIGKKVNIDFEQVKTNLEDIEMKLIKLNNKEIKIEMVNFIPTYVVINN